MSRKNKYRAWDFNKREMLEILNITQTDAGFVGATLVYKNGDHLSFGHNLILMQYIGIKDIHDVEVYEGDKVKFHQFLFDGKEVENELTGIVKYSDELACFCIDKIKNEFYQKHTGYDEGEGMTPICNFFGMHEESFEVIGNIFDNIEEDEKRIREDIVKNVFDGKL